MSEQVRIILVDDHELMRAGIRARLSVESAVEVVGEAGCGRVALGLVEQLKPDVLVTDITMKDLSGVELIQELQARQLGVRCLVLSMHGGLGYMQQAKRAGAAGYVVKDGPSAELCNAIRAVASGGTFFPQLPDAEVCPLTPREVETLRLICRGLRSKEIAEELGISVRTVDAHRMNIREKLGMDTVAELITYAQENALA